MHVRAWKALECTAISCSQVVGDASLGDISAEYALVIHARHPGGVVPEHQRGDSSQVVVDVDNGSQAVVMITASAPLGLGQGSVDGANRMTVGINHRDRRVVATLHELQRIL